MNYRYENDSGIIYFHYDKKKVKVLNKNDNSLTGTFKKLFRKAYKDDNITELPHSVRRNYIFNANTYKFIEKGDKKYFNVDGLLNKKSVRDNFVYYPKESILLKQEYSKYSQDEYRFINNVKKEYERIRKLPLSKRKQPKIEFRKTIQTLIKEKHYYNEPVKTSMYQGKTNLYSYDLDNSIEITNTPLVYHVVEDIVKKVSINGTSDNFRIILNFACIRNNERVEKYSCVYKYDLKGNSVFNYAKLENELNKLINNKYDDLFLENVQVGLFKKPTEGGCNSENSKSKNITISNKLKYTIYSPKSTNNNCLISCFMKALNIKGNALKPDTVRTCIGLEKGVMIDIKEIHKVADYFNVGFMLWDSNDDSLVEQERTPRISHKLDKDVVVEILLVGEHYSLIEGRSEYKKCDKCGTSFISKHTCNITKESFYQSIKSRKSKNLDRVQIRNINKPKMDYKNVILYDLETFQENTSHVVYACGWYNDSYKQCYGKNSIDPFVDEIMNVKGKLITAYNGSGFDHHFLMKQLLKRGVEIEKPILNNGKLMSYEFNGNKVFDLYLFVGSSLKKACESFNLENSKLEFDHSKMTSWESVDKYRDEVEPYLKVDVLALRELFINFNDMIYELESINIDKYITLSHMTYAIWSSSNYLNEHVEIFDDMEKYNFAKQSIYGGRTYPMKKESKSIHYDKIVNGKMSYHELRKSKEFIFNADATSLYPASMIGTDFLRVQYPIGKSFLIKSEMEAESAFYEGKCCILKVKFKPPKNIRVPILPRHKADGGIEWSLSDGEGVYTSVDIRNAINCGYSIEFTNEGLVWNNSADKLFIKFINKYYNLKEIAEKENNPVKRAIAKLLMNGLYGKMLQNAITSNQKICYSMKDVWEFMIEYDLKSWIVLDKDKLLLKGETKDELCASKITKPLQLGAFVLGYSRAIMLHYMKAIDPSLQKCVFTYTDTDSLHITGEDYFKLKELGYIVDNDKSKLGYLNNDVKEDGLIIYEKNLGPKQYRYEYITEDNKVYIKDIGTIKCKGIPKKQLKSEYYDLEKPQEVSFDGLKKKHTNLTKKDRDEGIEYFSITNITQTRTFCKNEWCGMDLNQDSNEWYPKGYSNYSICVGA